MTSVQPEPLAPSGVVAGRAESGRSELAAKTEPSRFPDITSVWTWFWGGLLLAGLPMLSIYFVRMWRLPHYQYFPFALLAVGYLVWTRSDRQFYPPARLLSLMCVGLGVAALAGGWLTRSPWMIAIAFFFFAAGCLNVMRGPHDRSLLALALPLALLVRLPLGYDQLLVLELQPTTTALSSLMLDVFGVPHAVDRNVIQMADRELFVAEACSGIQSVFTLAFMSTLLIVVYRRRLWLAPVYLLIACLLAVAGNVLRVTSVAMADYFMGWDWAEGWSHDLLGYFTLAVSAVFLLSFDQFVMSFLHPTSSAATESKENPVIWLWNQLVDDGSSRNLMDGYFHASKPRAVAQSSVEQRVTRWLGAAQSRMMLRVTAAIMIALIGVTTVRAFSVDTMDANMASSMFVDGLIFDPGENEVESYATDFQLNKRTTSRGGENPILGRNADVWHYATQTQNGLVEGQLVLSQSYGSFHELCFCYEIKDWELLNRFLREPPPILGNDSRDPDTADVPLAYAVFGTPSGARGHLWYASIGKSGTLRQPPERPGRLGNRFEAVFDATPDTTEPVMMIQIWVTSAEPLDVDSLAKVTGDFALIRQRISDRIQDATAGDADAMTEVLP